ncbi:MAG: SWIM zinc finger family protein, partial [Acidobacteriota bacterium]|nr:SWIM zinc finger family protein [Acidobacteriota bacterium]
MTSEVERLMAAVLDVLPRGLWSRGVALHREGAVLLQEHQEGSFVFRIAPRGGLLAEAVSLFPGDEDWECTCPSRQEACEHVAAAVIALHREGDSPGPETGGPLPLGYRLLSRPGGSIHVERVAVGPDGEEPLRAPIAALARGRAEGPRIAATPVDLEIERCLATPAGSEKTLLPWERLLPLLERCRDLRLDGRPIAADKTALMPIVVVEDHDSGGFVLRLRPARVERDLGRGLVVAGGKLRLRGEPGLTRREVEELGRGRILPRHRVGELVTEILPDLRRRLQVEVVTRRLPATASV